MSLVSCQNLSKAYAEEVILDEVTLQIYAGEKVGFVGANGAGKTTLMRILMDQIPADSGTVGKAKAARLAYLPQEAQLQSGLTLMEEAQDAVEHLLSMEDAIQAVHDQMAETDDEDELQAIAHHLDDLHEEFQRSGGYDYERRIEVVLHGVGFTSEQYGMRVEHMSGGQKSRAALAKLLLESPDLMLLDEPTNHLDIYGVEWLESYLAESDAAALIVSHDRYFLDKVATRIVELERGRITSYRGNYSQFVRVKAERLERQRKEYEAQQAEIAKQEEYIRRYHYGQRAREARGRQKKLERVERVEKPAEQKGIRLNITPKRRAGDLVVRAEGLGKRFGALKLFDGLDLEIQRGERVGIIGPNGAGKTTLLRVLLGQEPASEGAVELGANVDVGYYEQDLAGLSMSRSVIDEVWSIDKQATFEELRRLLAAFLFTDDEVDRPVGSLSGGEQCRVALAKLMWQRPNLLVLDEPTNHLDILARAALEDAFRAYEGTIVMVTHDRYLLNQVAQKVLWIEDGEAKLYHGDYDFVQWTRRRAKGDAAAVEVEQGRSKRDAYRERKRAERRAKSPYAKMKFSQLEAAIVDLEEKIASLETSLADPAVYTNGEKLKQVQAEYEAAKAELPALNEEWERRLEGMG